MVRFIGRRLLTMIPVLWVIATLTFFVMRLAPGGPFDSEKQISEDIRRNIEAKYHFDEPLYQQYARFMGDLIQGDLGPSFRYASRSVNEIIAETFPISFQLGMAALGFALIVGVSTGIFAATKQHSWRDYLPMAFAVLGICLPSFVIGPVLQLVFAIKLDFFHVSGWDSWRDMVLPSVTLGTVYAAYFSRLTRSGMLDVVRQDFIRTAYAKGLPERLVMVRHALKGGLLPVVTFLGPASAGLLTGSLVVELIFNIPGLGRYFVQSALNRDYTLVMGTVLFYAVLIMVMNLLVDIAYAFIDPRISYQ